MRRSLALLKYMPPVSGLSVTARKAADNRDIITTIHNNFPESVRHNKNIAGFFQGANRLQTASRIWQFLKKEIKYKRDPNETQMIRLPSRFIHDGNGDCKTYSLFTAGVLANLGMPVIFRYASYGIDPTPTHVYVVTLDENGKEIIIDAVYSKFNAQKKYTFKKDFKMDVRVLSGIGDNVNYLPIAGKKQRQERKEARKEKQAERKEKRQEKKAERKEKRAEKKETRHEKREQRKEKRKEKLQKLKGKASKVGLAPSRGAFLLLVGLNAFGIAKKLKRSTEIDDKKVKAFWEKVGGDYSKLKQAINKGANKKKVLRGIHGIGVVGSASVATAAVTATPLIIAAVKLIKTLLPPKEQNDEDMKDLDAAAQDSQDKYIDENGESPMEVLQDVIETAQTGKVPAKYANVGKPNSTSKSGSSASDAGGSDNSDNADDNGGDGEGFKLSTPVLLGAAAVALLAITSKK